MKSSMLRNFTLGFFLLALLIFTGCHSSGILSSNSGKSQVLNLAVTSNQLVNENQEYVDLTFTAHFVGSDSLFGSGHIQKAGDFTFYSEFEVVSAELVNKAIKLTGQITFSNTPEFVGIMLEIKVKDLGNDQKDEIELKFDTERKLGLTSPIEFEGPGLVVITPKQ